MVAFSRSSVSEDADEEAARDVIRRARRLNIAVAVQRRRVTAALAALLGGLGYSMVAGAVAQPAGSVTNSVAYLSVAFFMVGVSSPLAYVGAMYTATTILSVQMRPIAVLVVGVPNQLGGILAYGNDFDFDIVLDGP